MMTAVETEEAAWRVRPVLLAGIGALAAVIVHHLLDTVAAPPAWHTALGCGIAIATFAFGFSLERRRIGWVVGFAVSLGLIAGLILYWNHVPQMGTWGDWRYASLLLAIVIPVPLFQVAHARGAWWFPYAEVHAAAWTNVVLWCACWAFAGIAFALAWLLAGLFGLIGLHFLRDLLGHGWAVAMLFGAAFGGALGLLSERAGIVLLLQRVVTAVLGVLAPVLAAGLVLFLCALPFTGLGALWEATKATTPILLTCVIGALILANAVIGDGQDEEATNPLLRWGAMALAVAMLPLTLIAALATGLRIQQYGYSPDRLWALVFVILASVYAVGYLGSVVRGRPAGRRSRARRT